MIVLEFKSNKPIYEQIVEQYKYHVMKRHLKPGDSIPSVRKLALELKITPGTVAKAYQELERQQIIETVRGKGTFIAESPVMQQDENKVAALMDTLRACFTELKLMGYARKEVNGMVQNLYKELSL